MSAINKVTGFLAAAVIGTAVLGAAVSLPGCSQSEMQAIGQDLANTGEQVLADILAGKGYAQVLADVGAGGASLLVTVIQFITTDPHLTPAAKAAYVKACAPYLVMAKAQVAAEAK